MGGRAAEAVAWAFLKVCGGKKKVAALRVRHLDMGLSSLLLHDC